MNKMLYRLYLSIFCFMALLVAGPLGTAWSEDDLSEGQRLRKLESTQTGEARRLDKVADEVAWLLADLESNGLLEQGDGAKVENLKEVLGTVADTHLPAAAEHLRSARLEPTESKHHLTSADEEVGLVLEQLANVLAESSTLLAEEELVRELRDLIKEQTLLRGQAAEWGKSMLISPDTAGAGKGPLMQNQSNLLARFRKFLEKLQKTCDEAMDGESKSRFEQALRVLRPPAPTNEMLQQVIVSDPSTEDVLQAALDQIESLEIVFAVDAQDRAIASMKAALQILSTDRAELAEFIAGLEKLIEKQKVLRKDTDAEEDLENKHPFYEARQVEIFDEVTNFSFEAPDLFVSKEGEYLVEPLMIALDEAVSALNSAEKENALDAQDRVIAILESVYGTATEALDEEKEENDPFWAYSPEVPEEYWKLPDDGEEEDEEMVDEDFPEIFEGITSAELMIQPDSTAEGAQADVTTAMAANRYIGLEEEESEDSPDFITDEGPPSVGNKEAPDAPGGHGVGDTSAAEKDRLARESMQRRRQKSKTQDYVRQLPPEFRRQVADYYELIAE